MRNVIVIGGACAGYTAAIYAARANLKPLVFSGSQAGGQLMLTSDVENFPGFPEGILGPDLMVNMRKQAERFGAEFIDSDADKVDFSRSPFKVWSSGRQYEANSVIIATGASARWLGVRGEDTLRGKGVSACATCDGFFFRGKELVVVGGGDSAAEEASFLTKFASKVTIIHRKSEMRASKIMQERLVKNAKISFIWDAEVTEILGDGGVTGVKMRNVKTGATSEFKCNGVFVAIGHEPNTRFLNGAIQLDEKGYIAVKKHTMTSVEGVFAAGDVVDHRYRQAITASADGCRAAIDAERWLEEKGLA